MFVIVPLGWVVGIAGFVWSRKYLRYGIPAAALVGMGGMYAAVKNAEANAGPYGLRYGLIEITLPTGESQSFSSATVVDYWVQNHGKDRATVQEMVDRYRNGYDYATGYDLMVAIGNI